MVDFKTDRNNLIFKEAVKRLQLRFPVAEISKRMNYGKGNISNFLNDKKPVSDEFLDNFFRTYNLEREDEEIKVLNEPESNYNIVKEKGTPYYDIDFSLGFIEIQNNQQIKPDAYVTHPFFAGCDYVVRASGQSMAKLIKHGDAIGLIHLPNWQEFIPFGEVYAIVTSDGHRMVKVITKGDDDKHFTLISKPTDNKKDEFPPQQLKKSLIMQLYKVQATSHLF